MLALWISVAGVALIAFYALLPDSNLDAAPFNTAVALANDMAIYRNQLDQYVAAHPTAGGAVQEQAFAHTGNWSYTSLRWQNYVYNGIVVVYPATGAIPLPAGFLGALLSQSGYSVEAGATQDGQIVNPLNAGSNVPLPPGMPALSNGTPVWISQVF